MNKTIEQAFKKNIEAARRDFISYFKKEVEKKIKEEMIVADPSNGSLYLSSRFSELPEILIQEKTENIVIAYSKEKTFTKTFSKKTLKIEVEEDKNSIKIQIQDETKEETLIFDKNPEKESLSYLLYTFLTYLSIKTR